VDLSVHNFALIVVHRVEFPEVHGFDFTLLYFVFKVVQATLVTQVLFLQPLLFLEETVLLDLEFLNSFHSLLEQQVLLLLVDFDALLLLLKLVDVLLVVLLDLVVLLLEFGEFLVQLLDLVDFLFGPSQPLLSAVPEVA